MADRVPSDDECSCEDDPSYFLLLATERQIHECLGLAEVATVIPALTQGWNIRKLAFLRISYSGINFTGATAEASRANLLVWVDEIMRGLGTSYVT